MNSQEKRWYLSRDGQQHGPFSDADVANFAQLGQLQTNDHIWRDGFASWRSVATIFPPPEPTPAQAMPPANEPMRAGVDQRRRRQIPPRSKWGPTWTTAFIALMCSALIGAASGYVFRHYLANTELTDGSGRQ